ncbi:hypothetical protein BDW62DRAFT_35046 [Aspergillus aurantiobrunneus]
MPIAQMDALGAFSHLSDNLPTWISRLADLTTHTATKHAEFAEAFKKHFTTASKPRRRKNSSVCSIRTDSRRSFDEDASCDSADGPTVISTRHSLIIHYDGYTQATLEEMVRNIGTARNNLRKGKMSQLPLANGVRSPPPRSAARALLPASDEPDDLLASIRSSRNRGPPAPQPRTATRQSPFDLADKNLELAHSFCETAAYQFLRAGACASELESVKDRFTVLQKIVTEEVQRLEQEKKEEVPDEVEPEPPKATEELASLKRPASSEGMIEVDDEQASVESIDLTAFRVNRLRR